MQHMTGQFVGAGGLTLYYQSWHPLEQAQAIVGLVHGLGSHSGLFENLVRVLVAQRYSVYGFDLRGHGRSPGQRGYINRWAEFRDDTQQFCQLMATQNPHVPCFLFGHSLGAIIILDYGLHFPRTVAGLITMAPAFDPVGVSPLKLKVGQLLSQVWPRFTLSTGISHDAGSHDAAVIEAYMTDPLRHTKGTARLATEFLSTTRWIQTQLPQLQLPILILHGSADVVTLPTSSRMLFERLPLFDKEYREYEDGYHDLHNDIEAERVAHDIANWLDRHGTHPLVLKQSSTAE